MKVCLLCKISLPLTEFHRAKRHKDGLQQSCKSCLKIRQRARYRRNRERDIDKSKKWNKANAAKVAAGMARCREKRPEFYREYNKQWKQANREVQALYDARKRARRRAAKSATIGRISLEEWNGIKERQHYRCWYCNCKVKKLTQDHVVALVNGGSHTVTNIVAACRPCNSSKHSKSVEEFAKQRGRLFF